MKMPNNRVAGSGRITCEESLITRDAVLEALMEQPGLQRKEILAVIKKAYPDLDPCRLRWAIEYLMTSKQIHAKKVNGTPSKYYPGDLIDKQRIKIVPFGNWLLPSAPIYSVMEWSLHQLQGHA